MDAKSTTPKIGLTKNNTFIGCSNSGHQKCGGFSQGKIYTVKGTVNTSVSLGNNTQVIEVGSFELQ